MDSSTLKYLEVVLKKFNLQELCDIALQEFPETTWGEIQNKIVIHSEALIKQNVIKVLLNTVKDVSKEEIENRISNLLLLAVGKSLRKTWIAFQLLEKTTITSRDMLDNIKAAIRRTGMLANINMIKYNNRYVVSVEKKIITKKRVIKKQYPINFQFFSNEPYLFCSRRTIENKMMNAIIEALGYSKWKYCNLCGPNITDLLTLLKYKRAGTNIASLLSSEPQSTATFTLTETTADFGQRNEREKYAKQIFAENPPQLETLTVSLKDTTWQQTGSFDKMNDISLDGVNVMFRAPNIAGLFKEMIALGAVTDPIPEYMRAFLYTGKNHLKITQKK